MNQEHTAQAVTVECTALLHTLTSGLDGLWRQPADSLAQSRLVGVRSAGSVASASRTRARGMPSRCDIRMKATRRSVSRA